jgi:tetratricopeptide (TPR) repeat protein
VLDRLTDLVDKSLVIYDLPTNRYRMLGTVSEYARERLEAAGEAPALRRRHLDYHANLLEIAYDGLWGEGQGETLARLDTERENVLAALAACAHVEGGDLIGLTLAERTKPYWIIRGQLGLGHRLTEEAISRLPDHATAARAMGLFTLGELSFFMGRYADAIEQLEQCLGYARDADRKMAAGALNTLSNACIGCGDFGRARDYVTEGLAVARELVNRRLIAVNLNALAQLDRTEGDIDAAESSYAEALAITRELGDRESEAVTLLNLAMVAAERNATPRAAAALREALAIVLAIGSTRLGQCVLDVAAGLAAARGEWSRAARLCGASDLEMEATGLQRDPADEAYLRPRLEATRQALGATAFGEEAAAGRRHGYVSSIEDCRGWLAGFAEPVDVGQPAH